MPWRNVAIGAVASLVLVIGTSGIARADPVEDTAGEPANVGDAKTAAIAYHDSRRFGQAKVARQNWSYTRTATVACARNAHHPTTRSQSSVLSNSSKMATNCDTSSSTAR
jgi:hypothetical protein